LYPGQYTYNDKKSLVVANRPVSKTEPAHTNYKVGLEAEALMELLGQNKTENSQPTVTTRNPG
jgi:hypothetical protein